MAATNYRSDATTVQPGAGVSGILVTSAPVGPIPAPGQSGVQGSPVDNNPVPGPSGLQGTGSASGMAYGVIPTTNPGQQSAFQPTGMSGSFSYGSHQNSPTVQNYPTDLSTYYPNTNWSTVPVPPTSETIGQGTTPRWQPFLGDNSGNNQGQGESRWQPFPPAEENVTRREIRLPGVTMPTMTTADVATETRDLQQQGLTSVEEERIRGQRPTTSFSKVQGKNTFYLPVRPSPTDIVVEGSTQPKYLLHGAPWLEADCEAGWAAFRGNVETIPLWNLPPRIPQPSGTPFDHSRYLDGRRVPLNLTRYQELRSIILKACTLNYFHLLLLIAYSSFYFQEVDRLWNRFIEAYLRNERELVIRKAILDLRVVRERNQITPFHHFLYQRLWDDLLAHSSAADTNFIDLPRSVALLEYTKVGMWMQFLHENQNLVTVALGNSRKEQREIQPGLSSVFNPSPSPRRTMESPLSVTSTATTPPPSASASSHQPTPPEMPPAMREALINRRLLDVTQEMGEEGDEEAEAIRPTSANEASRGAKYGSRKRKHT